MDRPRNIGRPARAALLGALVLSPVGLVLTGIADFGIWDPWELEVAEAARRLLEGRPWRSGETHVWGHIWLTSMGFRAFGVHEWAGRLPVATCGLAALLLAWYGGRQLAGGRVGLYAVVTLASMPLFVFNARPMAGAAPALLAQAGIALAGAGALLRANSGERHLWLVACLALVPISTWLSGALLGPVPALLGVGAVALFGGPGHDPKRRAVATVLVAAAAGMTAATVAAVLRDDAANTMWTGGTPRSVAPPSYESVLARVFHAAAPWSALAPLALVPLRGPESTTSPRAALRLLVLTWLACGYCAQTVFLSRYGQAASFLPAVALALLLGLWLDELDHDPRPRMFAGIVALLLVGLLVRDYALYPSAPIEALSLKRFEVPEAFNPRAAWAALFGLFGLVTWFVLAIGDHRPELALTAPYRLIGQQWARRGGFRVWIALTMLLLLLLVAVGAVAWVMPGALGQSVRATKTLRALALVPPLIPVCVAALQVAWWLAGKLGSHRVVAIAASGIPVAVYASQGFLPSLAEQLSPKEVYVAFNELAQPGAQLAEYGVSRRAAAYYARGDVVETDSVSDLAEFLSKEEDHRWAVFPTEDLAALNRRFRRKTGRHLFIADAPSQQVLLASNRDLEGQPNRNTLARHVLKKVPDMQHPQRAVFDDRVELLGYRLELQHGTFAGAGESIEITWYFRCLKRVRTDHKVFLHIDRSGQRIHGDHVPIDGKYPVKMWEPGDIIVDRHTVEAASNQRPGKYQIYIGFYAGETRMKVTEGPNDGKDRVMVGTLDIR
ncbi:MAG: glycosyltransferase family 39 protein [Myxococcales bacterium]|nr:glycosyltransferase family 39 protein [Myxococcales bacterium]